MMATSMVKAALTIFILLICVSLVGSAFAQTTVSVGVSNGDSFEYGLKYVWSSTDNDDVTPSNWISNNQTDYYKINVDSVIGRSLKLSTIWRFLNGTEIAGTEIVEVGNNNVTGFIYIYAADLDAGSPLFPLATDLPFIINNTVFRSYNKELRATNHIEVNRTDLSDLEYRSMDIYFDKETGVLVEATIQEVYSDRPTQTYTTHITLRQPAFPISTTIPTSTPTETIISSPTPTSTGTQFAETQWLFTGSIYFVIGLSVLILVGTISIAIFINNRARSLTIIIEGEGGTTKPLPSTKKYKRGTQVTVEAIPDKGWTFGKWGGDFTGKLNNPINLILDSHLIITASFVQTKQERKSEDQKAKNTGSDQAEQERKRDEYAKQEQDRQRKEQERNKRDDWNTPDPYGILHVTRFDTYDKIKGEWRKLALLYHPDRVREKDPITQELYARQFNEVNMAWEQIKKDRGWI